MPRYRSATSMSGRNMAGARAAFSPHVKCERKVSTALRAYALLVASVVLGAVRDKSVLPQYCAMLNSLFYVHRKIVPCGKNCCLRVVGSFLKVSTASTAWLTI